MPYNVGILADSVNSVGNRLVTFELQYPRIIHNEVLTHRSFSRNTASSRAIPVEKMIQRVIDDPVMPVYWGRNQKGMQAAEELTGEDRRVAEEAWLRARDDAVRHAENLMALGVHKQIANRVIEPWLYVTAIVTATEYGNWFALRTAPQAQPEIRKLADMMLDAYLDSTPIQRERFDWHLPLVKDEEYKEFDIPTLIKLSVGRCARVSYLTHAGERDPAADIALHDQLVANGHVSPLEHQAQARGASLRSGNLVGWLQYRKTMAGECRTFDYEAVRQLRGRQ